MQTYEQFIEKHGLKFSAVRVDSRPDSSSWKVGTRHFKTTIRKEATKTISEDELLAELA